MHVVVALKRTWDISLGFTVSSGKMNLAFSGITLLLFMIIHLFQFRFGHAKNYVICEPPYFINTDLNGLLGLHLFTQNRVGCPEANSRDIYGLEYSLFKSL